MSYQESQGEGQWRRARRHGAREPWHCVIHALVQIRDTRASKESPSSLPASSLAPLKRTPFLFFFFSTRKISQLLFVIICTRDIGFHTDVMYCQNRYYRLQYRYFQKLSKYRCVSLTSGPKEFVDLRAVWQNPGLSCLLLFFQIHFLNSCAWSPCVTSLDGHPDTFELS